MTDLVFISKDASWQKYRLDIISKLSDRYNLDIEIVTEKNRKKYIKNTKGVIYKGSFNIFPAHWKVNFYPLFFLHVYKKKPKVVLALANASNLTELTLPLFSRILGFHLVYWSHGYDHCRRPTVGIKGFINRIRVYITRRIISKANSVICFSDKGKEYLVNKGLDRDKLFVAPNTLDTDALFKSKSFVTPELVKKLKNELSINKYKNVILFSGRLREGKKLINGLTALKYINRPNDLCLLVVGDGEESNNLKHYAELNDLDNVRFLGSIFDEVQLATIFSISDLFLMPGYVGLAIVHAFCFGLPIITEDIDFHSPEIMYLENGINGYFVPKDNPEAMAMKIKEIIDNPILLEKLSREAEKTAKHKASINNMVSNMAAGLSFK